MHIQNLAGYKFVLLNNTSQLREKLLSACKALSIKGTILLSHEGINLNLAGSPDAIKEFISYLQQDNRFSDMTFKYSYSDTVPFKRLKVKLKKEIITLRQPSANPLETETKAPNISPEQLKQWLDDQRDITILDTRNDYEVDYGTFENAINLHISDFTDFPKAVEKIDNTKPIVMFCTGGIRCEKAALYMINQGVKEVYQLEGGILNYFEKVGGAHYQGGCFVFDERVALSPKLAPIAPDSL